MSSPDGAVTGEDRE
jgi:hypothetical protein